MSLLFGEADLEAMQRLRARSTPSARCNPGKIFPTTRFCAESNPKARGYDRVPLSMGELGGLEALAPSSERAALPRADRGRRRAVDRDARAARRGGARGRARGARRGALRGDPARRAARSSASATRRAAPTASSRSTAFAGVDELDAERGRVPRRARARRSRSCARARREAGWELPLDDAGRGGTLGGALATASVAPRALGFGAPARRRARLRGGARRRPAHALRRPRREERDGLRPGEALLGSLGALGVITARGCGCARGPRRVRVLAAAMLARRRGRGARRASRRAAARRARSCLLCDEARGLRADRRARGRRARASSATRAALAQSGLRVTRSRRCATRARDAPLSRACPSTLRFASSSLPTRAARRASRVLRDAGRGAARAARARARLRARAGAARADALFDAARSAARARAAGASCSSARRPSAKRGRDVFGDTARRRRCSRRALKARFDPGGVLNPGRFAGGI